MEGKLHLITVVYSLHPLDKFTSLKEISESLGKGSGRELLIFTVYLAQFKAHASSSPRELSNRFKFSHQFVQRKSIVSTLRFLSLPLPWFPVFHNEDRWESMSSWERHCDNTA